MGGSYRKGKGRMNTGERRDEQQIRTSTFDADVTILYMMLEVHTVVFGRCQTQKVLHSLMYTRDKCFHAQLCSGMQEEQVVAFLQVPHVRRSSQWLLFPLMLEHRLSFSGR